MSTWWQHAPITSPLSRLTNVTNAVILLRTKILSQDQESDCPDPSHIGKTDPGTVPKLSDTMSITPGLPHNLCPYKVMLFVFGGLRERGGGRGEFLESHFRMEEILSTQTRLANPSTHPPTRSLFITLALQPLDRKQLGPYVRLLITLAVFFPVHKNQNQNKLQYECVATLHVWSELRQQKGSCAAWWSDSVLAEFSLKWTINKMRQMGTAHRHCTT